MSNPNATYKQAFADLTIRLGRTPTANDEGWRKIAEDLRLAWVNLGQAPETVLAPTSAAGPQGQGFSRQPAPQASAIDAREAGLEALGEPGTAKIGQVASECPEQGNGAVSLYEGARGPGGGIVGKCGRCGRLWERAKAKGRPSALCGECRG